MTLSAIDIFVETHECGARSEVVNTADSKFQDRHTLNHNMRPTNKRRSNTTWGSPKCLSMWLQLAPHAPLSSLFQVNGSSASFCVIGRTRTPPETIENPIRSNRFEGSVGIAPTNGACFAIIDLRTVCSGFRRTRCHHQKLYDIKASPNCFDGVDDAAASTLDFQTHKTCVIWMRI